MKYSHIHRKEYILEILIFKWWNNMEILMKDILIWAKKCIPFIVICCGGEVIEFGIPGDATAEIYNVDIYVLGQFPIYDYGEELIVDEKIY